MTKHEKSTLDEIIDNYGPPGKGNGSYTAASYIGQQLTSLETKGVLKQTLGGIPIPKGSNCGNPKIAEFEHISGTNINSGLTNSLNDDSHPDEVSDQDKSTYIEGAVIQVNVNRYERDPKARQQCINSSDPKFTCKACDMNFGTIYGAKGNNFIHVHHIIPLSQISKEYQVDPKNDLIQLCPNCHAMVHRGMTVVEIRKKLKLL